MPDDLISPDGREDASRSRVPPRTTGDSRPADGRGAGRLADREVPIELARTPDRIHAWLDGELSESEVRGTESIRHLEFWKRLDRDLEMRRQAQAPADLTARIMEALPATAPHAVAPWWNRPVEMNPVAVAAAAAGLLSLGAAIGATLHR
jgi:hypothetical protein